MRILVTRGVGFIGISVIRQTIARGHSILNFDVLDYAVSALAGDPNDAFVKDNSCNHACARGAFPEFRPQAVLQIVPEGHMSRPIINPNLTDCAQRKSKSFVRSWVLKTPSRTAGAILSSWRFVSPIPCITNFRINSQKHAC